MCVPARVRAGLCVSWCVSVGVCGCLWVCVCGCPLRDESGPRGPGGPEVGTPPCPASAPRHSPRRCRRRDQLSAGRPAGFGGPRFPGGRRARAVSGHARPASCPRSSGRRPPGPARRAHEPRRRPRPWGRTADAAVGHGCVTAAPRGDARRSRALVCGQRIYLPSCARLTTIEVIFNLHESALF